MITVGGENKMGSPKAGARAFVVGSKVLAQKKAEFGVACVLSDNQTPGILSSFHHRIIPT